MNKDYIIVKYFEDKECIKGENRHYTSETIVNIDSEATSIQAILAFVSVLKSAGYHIDDKIFNEARDKYEGYDIFDD